MSGALRLGWKECSSLAASKPLPEYARNPISNYSNEIIHEMR